MKKYNAHNKDLLFGQKKLANRIFNSLVGGILLICAVLIAVSFVFQMGRIQEQTEAAMQENMLDGTQTIRLWLQRQSTLLSSMAEETTEHQLYRAETRDATEAYWDKRAAADDSIITYYMAAKDGLWIDSTYWRPEADYVPAEREWYQKAMLTDGVAYTAPYTDAQTGSMVISISTQVKNNGEFQGVFAADILMDTLVDYISQSISDDGSFIFLVGSNAQILAHPNSAYSPEGEKFVYLDDLPHGKELALKIRQGSSGEIMKLNDSDGQNYYYSFSQIPENDWNIISVYPARYEESTFRLLVLYTVLAFAASLGFIFLIVRWISQKYLDPIQRTTDAITLVTDGSLTIPTNNIPRNSQEIESLLNSVEKMSQQNKAYIREIDRVLGDLANGDFRVSVEENYVGDYAGIRIALDNIAKKLGGALYTIHKSFDKIISQSHSLEKNTAVISDTGKNQKDAQGSLQDAVEQIADQVRMNSGNAENVRTISSQTKEDVSLCSHQMEELSQAIGKIRSCSEEIGKIADAIQEIAKQTNILALNASVEAARVGPAGKGFAVVAEEVRTLAAKCAQSAKSTTALVQETVQSVEEGVALTAAASDSLNKVVDGSEDIQRISSDIADGINRQLARIETVLDYIGKLDAAVSKISEVSNDSSEISSQITQDIEYLNRQISQFRIKYQSL